AIGLPPFVATLATLVGLRSLSRALAKSVTDAVTGHEKSQINIDIKEDLYLDWSLFGVEAKDCLLPAAFVVIALAAWLIMGRTVTGRHLYALGGNEDAARLSGIRTDRLKWLAYCTSAGLSSIAGIFYITQIGTATPESDAMGYELNAIAAAVVGGCSLQGGVGTIPGTVLGALFLRTIIDGVSKVIKTESKVYEGLIVGVVVVFAVAFSQSRRTRGGTLLGGTLGVVTIANLSLLAGVMAALVGPKLFTEAEEVNPLWMAAGASAVTLLLLIITRWREKR
ncbi:MAG: ABC transporter permease, partial [Planctomycetaceae bacterium]